VSAAQRQALDRLAQALNQVSAGSSTAKRLQEGDYQGASSQLSQLADDLDQLSKAAKDQLAQALRDAANDPSTRGTRLADRERLAASALSGSDYDSQRRALQDLAREITRSPSPAQASQASASQGTSRSTADQKTTARVGQADPAAAQKSGSGSGQGSGSKVSQGSSSAGQPIGSAQGAADGSDAAAADGTESGSGGSKGAGSGNEQQAPSPEGPSTSLDVAGEQVEVPAQLSGGGQISASDGSGDPTSTIDASSASSGTGSFGPQEPGLVPSEQNSVPSGRRDVVRDYFNGEP
jgi:hypothetical protein